MPVYYVQFPKDKLQFIQQNNEKLAWNHLAIHRISGDFLCIVYSDDVNEFQNSLISGDSLGQNADGFVDTLLVLPSDYATHWDQIFEPTKPIEEIESEFETSSLNLLS